MTDPMIARIAAIPRTIAVIGLMGAGKTHIGKRLATALHRPFVDSDAEIEHAAGQSIRDIFDTLGEAAFREGERKIVSRLIDAPPSILSTGGGAFIDPTTRAALLERALCVWLRADLDLLVLRTQGRTTRPLLMRGDPRQILGDLMKVRYPIYAEAHVAVDTRNEPSDITTSRVLQAIDTYWQARNLKETRTP